MGASSSTQQQQQQSSREQQELESLAASTGALPDLHKSFAKLSDPQTNSIPLSALHDLFSVKVANLINSDDGVASSVQNSFLKLLSQLGQAIVDLFFVADKGGVNWVEFLRGYTKCCARMPVSMYIHTLFRVFDAASEKAGFLKDLEFEFYDTDCKINGNFKPGDLVMLLWLCWVMSQGTKRVALFKVDDKLGLPDIDHIVLSAISTCIEGQGELKMWDCSALDLEVQIPAQNVHAWILKMVPGLADCFSQYVHARIKCGSSEDALDFSCLLLELSPPMESHETHILTWGRAWAISLTLRSTLSEEILNVCAPKAEPGVFEDLLYRSSLHGKGLNRFWSNIEGYNGPMLILVSASSPEVESSIGRLVIGVLTQQGFENKDVFYGSSGDLYAISPVFHVFPHGGGQRDDLPLTGKEKNFVYSHLHPSSRVYEPHPKPVGLAFGGTMGNERIFIDEDFTKVIIRHHAVDKTYQHGSLIPNQMLSERKGDAEIYQILPCHNAELSMVIVLFNFDFVLDMEEHYHKRFWHALPPLTLNLTVNASSLQGFLPVEAQILEVEVWGLGGEKSKRVQDMYKKREEMFTEQRRKVDLKTFASWEDSPEKMMLDMVSDPNSVRREDR
ncbi:hypothetical protein Sjap_017039 [Stephania japonica]|uniref:TLDc domain-containing protein n=1 Tax=Stephania japonica TaxID=461633 RepID=A0AAP0I5E8_9MAGN